MGSKNTREVSNVSTRQPTGKNRSNARLKNIFSSHLFQGLLVVVVERLDPSSQQLVDNHQIAVQPTEHLTGPSHRHRLWANDVAGRLDRARLPQLGARTLPRETFPHPRGLCQTAQDATAASRTSSRASLPGQGFDGSLLDGRRLL